VLGSASHEGLGRLPAMVVSNMRVSVATTRANSE
jgi:hypothetical protein